MRKGKFQEIVRLQRDGKLRIEVLRHTGNPIIYAKFIISLGVKLKVRQRGILWK